MTMSRKNKKSVRCRLTDCELTHCSDCGDHVAWDGDEVHWCREGSIRQVHEDWEREELDRAFDAWLLSDGSQQNGPDYLPSPKQCFRGGWEAAQRGLQQPDCGQGEDCFLCYTPAMDPMGGVEP